MYSTTGLPFLNVQKKAFFTTLGLVEKSLNLFSTRRREILKRLDFFSTPPNAHKTTRYKKKKCSPMKYREAPCQSSLHCIISFPSKDRGFQSGELLRCLEREALVQPLVLLSSCSISPTNVPSGTHRRR